MDALEGYALMLEPDWATGGETLKVATIDLSSGSHTDVPVTGFHTYGETPRSFMFDRERTVFMLLQTNFTGDNGGDRSVHLYSIDARTGATTRQLVVGARNLVSGYQFVEERRTIVFSTEYFADDRRRGTVDGYNFYTLDIGSAAPSPAPLTPRLVSHYKVQGEPSSAGNYDGFFHAVSRDLRVVFRVGYEHVVESENYGVGVTDISTNPATTRWVSLPLPADHGRFRSLTLAHETSPTVRAAFPDIAAAQSPRTYFFLSLAPTSNVTRADTLDLFLWPLDTATFAPPRPQQIKAVARFPNAHTQPTFGPIAETLSGDDATYAAVLVAASPLGSLYDVMALAVADVGPHAPPGGNATELELTPMLLAQTASVAGFGIPTSASPKWADVARRAAKRRI